MSNTGSDYSSYDEKVALGASLLLHALLLLVLSSNSEFTPVLGNETRLDLFWLTPPSAGPAARSVQAAPTAVTVPTYPAAAAPKDAAIPAARVSVATTPSAPAVRVAVTVPEQKTVAPAASTTSTTSAKAASTVPVKNAMAATTGMPVGKLDPGAVARSVAGSAAERVGPAVSGIGKAQRAAESEAPPPAPVPVVAVENPPPSASEDEEMRYHAAAPQPPPAVTGEKKAVAARKGKPVKRMQAKEETHGGAGTRPTPARVRVPVPVPVPDPAHALAPAPATVAAPAPAVVPAPAPAPVSAPVAASAPAPVAAATAAPPARERAATPSRQSAPAARVTTVEPREPPPPVQNPAVGQPERTPNVIPAPQVAPKPSRRRDEERRPRISEATRSDERGLVVAALKGDLKLVSVGDQVKITVSFREFPKSRRNRPPTKAEAKRVVQLTPLCAQGRDRTSETVIEKSEEGVYIITAEPREHETAAKASFILKIYEEGSDKKSVPLGKRTLTGRTVLAKILMPEGILWNDDSAFTGSLEDSESTTKFNAQTGLYWKEYDN